MPNFSRPDKRFVARTFSVGVLAFGMGVTALPAASAQPSGHPAPSVTRKCVEGSAPFVNSHVKHHTVLYQTSFEGPSSGTATEGSTKTTSWSVTGTVEAEEGAIFVKVKESVSGSIEHTSEAAYGSLYTVHPKKNKIEYVAYESPYYIIHGHIEHISAQCVSTNEGNWVAKAPLPDGWFHSSKPIANS
jgi:hypothetical protein